MVTPWILWEDCGCCNEADWSMWETLWRVWGADWIVWGDWLEGVRKLEGVERWCEGCGDAVWRVSGGCLDSGGRMCE